MLQLTHYRWERQFSKGITEKCSHIFCLEENFEKLTKYQFLSGGGNIKLDTINLTLKYNICQIRHCEYSYGANTLEQEIVIRISADKLPMSEINYQNNWNNLIHKTRTVKSFL